MPKKGSRSKGRPLEAVNEPFDEVGMNKPCLDQQEQQQLVQGPSEERKEPLEALRTPVRHRTRLSTGDGRWDSMLAHQFQTPERHRRDLASLLASPQTHHLGSPGGGLASPSLVPLFQPSPKRTLQSPHQPSGVNSFGNIFQSPVRPGDLQGSDFLRYETPSSKPRFGGLLSPSPVPGKRQTLGGQHRQRAVSLEARGWQLGGLPGAAAEGFAEADDEQEEFIKDILQSPGPKDVQQLAERPYTRSRSILAPADAAVPAAVAAAADPIRRPQQLRRRALDFSAAGDVQQELSSVLATHKHTRRSSSHAGVFIAAAAAGAASGAEDDQHQQQPEHPRVQLPLIPLDLSECEKHNPSSPFKQLPSLISATPRRSTRRQQHAALEAVFTSPRSAIDAAMAHITQGALPALEQTSNLESLQGLEDLNFNLDSVEALKGLHGSGLVKPAFEVLSKAAAAEVAAGSSDDTAAAATDAAGKELSVMALLSTAAAAGETSGEEQQQQEQQMLPLEALQQQFEQYQQQLQAYEVAAEQDTYMENADSPGMHDETPQQQHRQRQQRQEADSDSDYEDEQIASATAGRGRRDSGNKRWNLRQHTKKQYGSVELQPSRRSRRIAGDTPDDGAQEQQQQQDNRSTPGSSGRSKRHQSRTASMQQLEQQEQELEQSGTPEDSMHQQQENEVDASADADKQQQQQEEEQTAVDAAEGDESDMPRSRRVSKQKGRRGSKRQAASKAITDESGMETEATDADAAAAAMLGLPPVTGLQQLLQSGGLLQLPNGMTVPIGVTPSKGGISALLGPNTPDDMRVAHMAQSFGMPVRSCNCKKSQCLKLYCDCFANNVFCNGCSCTDCHNVESNHTEVLARRSHIQQRDPTAFIAKLAPTDAETLANRKGCKCKKSHCLKKYCECFQMGVRCADFCKCTDCRNIEDGTNSLHKKMLPRTLHAAAAAQAGSSTRIQHQHQQLWPLAQGLGTAAAGPATSAAMGLGSVLVRIPGGPNTPGSSQLMCLPIQSPADQAAAAAAIAQLHGSSSTGPSAAGAAAGSGHLPRIAKPLLPQFLQAAAGGAGQATTPTAAAAERVKLEARSQDTAAGTAAEADDAVCLLSDEELPTPDQQAALDHAAALTAAQQQQHHHSLASPASSTGAPSSRGRSPARALNLDRVASQEGSVLRTSSNSLSSPIPALQHLQATAAGVSPVIRQQSPAAAGSSSAGGALHGSPKIATAGVGSASSRAKHRLASTSRAHDEDLHARLLHKQQQQPQQQQGILALVGAHGAAPVAAATPAAGAQQQQQAGMATRRQLLQQVKPDPDSAAAAGLQDSSHWARPAGARFNSLQPQSLFSIPPGATAASSHWQKVPPAAEQQFTTPGKKAPAADGEPQGQTNNPQNDVSPVQQIVLGPNGPTVALSQRTLNDVMTQSFAAYSAGAAAQAPQGAAGGDESSQAAGMLMTVVDDYGHVQYYFLPVMPPSTTAVAAAAKPQQQAAAVDAEHAQASKENHQQQQQQSHYQLRRRANPLQGTGLQQLPEDMIIDQPTGLQQQPMPAAAAVTPTKQLAASPSRGRCLRSSSNTIGSSPAKTPSKQRSTPVKRKAVDADEDDQAAAAAAGGGKDHVLQPSPAKLRHKMEETDQQQQQWQVEEKQQEHSSPPQQQQLAAARQVILSPVKRTRDGGLVVLPPQQQQQQDFGLQISSQEANNTAAAAASAGITLLQGIPVSPSQFVGAAAAAPFVSPQRVSEPMAVPGNQLSLQQGQPGMELFVASTADGQQFILQAPIGTDPATLLHADGTVDAACLGTLGSAAAAVAAAAGQGEQHGLGSAAAVEKLQQYGIPGSLLQPLQNLQQQGFAGSPRMQNPQAFGLQSQGSLNSGSMSAGDTGSAAAAASGSSSGRRPRELLALSPTQPKVVLSPRDTRTRDGSMFKFSPGCTTVFSPTKPKLGDSPRRLG